MKLRSLLLGCIVGLCAPAWAQTSEVDVTSVLADTKTFIFDNNKNTVKGYIYAELEDKTSCCGEDRIYLEVKIDPSGYVVSAQPLTGKNDCMKQSAVDIVKNIKWDAADFKGPKSVYFEIKPNIACQDGMENAYAELEIFNNPLLNPDGTRATTPSGAPTTVAGTEQGADSAQIKELIAVTGNDREEPTAEAEEPATEPEAEAEAGKPTEQPFVTEEPTEEPATEVADSGEPRLPEPIADAEGTSRGEQDPSMVSARDKAAAEEIAKQKEIEQLRKQLETMRVEEEKRQEALRRQEAERKRREEQMKQSEQQNDGFMDAAGSDQLAADADDGGGGLYFEDDGSSEGDFQAGGDFNEGGTFAEGDGEEERLLAEIDELRQRQEEVRQELMRRKEERMRIAEENRQANQEIIRLEEEIAMKEEEAARVQEQAELDRMAQEKEQIAQERAQENEEYERMMEEIRRLQAEAEQKIEELEAKKAEIARMEQLRKAREQEITLQRALREKERQKRLMEIRAQLGAGETVSSGSLMASGVSDEDIADLMSQIDLSAEADSEAIKLLIQQIEQMRKEMQLLQLKINQLEGGAPAPTGSRSGSINLSTNQTTPRQTTPPSGGNDKQGKSGQATSDGVKSAAADDSWKDIDIFAPDVPTSEYGGASQPSSGGSRGGQPTNNPNATPAQVNKADYDDVRGYTSLADDEHENLPGPKAGVRDYIDGRDAMKQLIKNKLKQGSICGLAQALFSVTLDPQGSVVRHSILAVNGPDKTDIELQLATIIPTLKFTKADVRFNQTIYLEFKAEILCEGSDKVDLKTVDPILKTQK